MNYDEWPSWLRKFERLTASSTFPQSPFSLLIRKARYLIEFCIRSVWNSKNQGSLEALRQLRNSQGGKACLVLASGPSTSKVNFERTRQLQKAEKVRVFVMNNFACSTLSKQIRPDYYVLSDPHHKLQNTNPQVAKILKYLISNPNITLVVPRHWNSDKSLQEIPNSVIYFEDRSLEGLTIGMSPTRPRSYASLTSLKALAIAGYLGFSQIFIAGFDTNLFLGLQVTKENRILQNSVHVSGSATNSIQDLTQFYPNGLADYFFDVAQNFYQLTKFGKKLPIKNLDFDSLVDAFEKSDDLQLLNN